MSANAPTARGHLQKAKTTYMSWGSFDFELTGSNVYRPGLSAAIPASAALCGKGGKAYSLFLNGLET